MALGRMLSLSSRGQRNGRRAPMVKWIDGERAQKMDQHLPTTGQRVEKRRGGMRVTHSGNNTFRFIMELLLFSIQWYERVQF